MGIKLYDITGKVIDGNTKQGVPNLRVEAWDKDVKYNDLLGSTITNAEGGFEISFDSTYFREYAPDENPDLFFKVYKGKKLLKSTEETPIKNAGEHVTKDIILNMPAIVRPEGKDRVSTEQILNAAVFFQASDFKGVYDQYRKQMGTTLGFVSDMVMNSVAKFDFKPIKPTLVKQGEDVARVKKNLQAKEITVENVHSYHPTLDRASMKTFTLLPADLKPGTRVNLYQENGKVKYYSVIKEDTSGQVDDLKMMEEQKHQLNKMQEELIQTKQIIEEKDKQITNLQEELNVIRKDHDDIKSMLKSDAFIKLLKEVPEPTQPIKGRKKPPPG